jgi:hypothetical protein
MEQILKELTLEVLLRLSLEELLEFKLVYKDPIIEEAIARKNDEAQKQ